jgi:hypothetical protein
MSPETHLLASWIIGAKTTDNPRDCRLVTLAGILPDLDGLGIIVDLAGNQFGWKSTDFYWRYHHYLLHGALGGILVAVSLARQVACGLDAKNTGPDLNGLAGRPGAIPAG